jgi:hypothetical protein
MLPHTVTRAGQRIAHALPPDSYPSFTRRFVLSIHASDGLRYGLR